MKRAPSLLFVLVIAVWTCGYGCHLLLPFSSSSMTTYAAYRATAQIYRSLPGGLEFTEAWQMYGWPPSVDRNNDGAKDATDTRIYFEDHLKKYIQEFMAPAFTWQYRNLTVVADTEKRAIGDCSTDLSLEAPLAHGAPLGAEVVWTNPDVSDASAWCQVFYSDGGNGIANPPVTKAVVRFAERGGFPDMWTGQYDPSIRHLRFSDMFIQLGDFYLDNPSDAHITDAYVQSFGTAFARGNGVPNYDFSTSDPANFFINVTGVVSDETGVTQMCFNNSQIATVYERQNSSPIFDFLLTGEVRKTDGTLVADFLFDLSSPEGTLFAKHQPYVELKDRTTTNKVVTLTPDVALDKDGDLDRFLWFENFEESDESFLGQGQTLTNVAFSLGKHEITAVAYDKRGAYNSATMTLDVQTQPPVALCRDVTVSADASCKATASVDNGSYDPEGTSLSYVQTPAGPYPLGKTQVTLEVTDADGAKASCTAEVTVEDDTVPAVSCPADQAVDTASGTCSATVSFTLPQGSDNCGIASVTSTPASGSTFGKGTTPVTVKATDTSGNSGTCTFNVVVDDVEAPTISCPANVTADATAPSGAAVSYPQPAASDNCTVSTTCTPAAGSIFAIGTTTVTCTADDGSGNSSSCTFTVKVKSAAEQTSDLIGMVQSLSGPNLDPGVRNALIVKLQAALAAISQNKTTACQTLLAFINQVNAQMGKKIVPASEGTLLINAAVRIRSVLGC